MLGKEVIKSRLSIFSILLLFVGGTLIVITILLLIYFSDMKELSLIVILFGIIPALCCIYAAYFFFGRKKVVIYENGMVFIEDKNKKTILWENVTEITVTSEWVVIQGIPVWSTVVQIIDNKKQESILMSDIGRIHKIKQEIIESCRHINVNKERKIDFIQQ